MSDARNARQPPARRRIGILGGTFDPIHVGHLALARSARAALGLDEIRFIPTGSSWQKDSGVTGPGERLDMVRLAVADDVGFIADDREARRSGPSYTVDTLTELRAEFGPEPSLVLLLGSDQLHNLPTWHRWRELIQLAHIACTQRERSSLEVLPPEVEALLQAHGRQSLPDAAFGAVVLFSMPPVPVSATALRAQFARGQLPVGLVPPAVLEYIESRKLYGRVRAH